MGHTVISRKDPGNQFFSSFSEQRPKKARVSTAFLWTPAEQLKGKQMEETTPSNTEWNITEGGDMEDGEEGRPFGWSVIE